MIYLTVMIYFTVRRCYVIHLALLRNARLFDMRHDLASTH